MDGLYFPVETVTIRHDGKVPVEVFFKADDGKMTLYRAGDDIHDAQVHDTVINRGPMQLYVLKKDKMSYDAYREKNLASLLTDPTATTNEKARSAYDSVTTIARQLFENPRGHIIERYKTVIMAIVGFIFDDTQALGNLIKMTSFDFGLYNHSVNVGLFGTGLACDFLGKGPGHNLPDIAAGFFMHDIGFTSTPAEILNKRGSLSPPEWNLIRRHPQEGLNILKKFGVLTPEAGIITVQHHERHDGSGYPQGLRGDAIHTYARICAIADVFEGITSERPHKKRKSSFQALKIMKSEMSNDFDPELFAMFVRLFTRV